MNLTESFRARTGFARNTSRRLANYPKSVRILLVALFIAALYVTPYWTEVPVLGWIVNTPGTSFPNVLTDQVMIYVLVALGLNVVVGLAGLLDLGYVGFYAVGAYTTAVLTSAHGNLPWLLCLPIAVVISMLAGLVLGTPTLRLRGDYLAIVTLGF
ncbi:MAG: branched-chain amino acid ABC transporter permease, partial [Actinobacteria bacterium]|nr:branched-chain amino acid ABC transporter permease [Actinomycetota bacterium]